MSAPLESEIGRLLEQTGDTGLVADELVKRWERNLYTPDEQFTLAQFLYRCGFYPTLLTQILRLLRDERRIPWAQFADILEKCGMTVDKAVAEAFLTGAEAQFALDELLRTRVVDGWDAVFTRKRAALKARLDLEVADRRERLREQMGFFRSQRMFADEAMCLRELQILFPNEAEFAREAVAYKERFAREIISQSTSETDVTRELSEKAHRLSPEQSTFKKIFGAQAIELATRQPKLAYDLALALFFMEFYAEAIDALKFYPETWAADWFRLELLLKSRQYLVALEETNLIELRYAGDPEATFAVIYARARALWGLGQSSMAIDLIRSIVNIRPNYKAAHPLLLDWTGGEL